MKKQSKYYQLAVKYAPVFAQKVSKEWQVADQIAPVDYAGQITDVAKNPDKLYSIKKKDENKYVIPPKVYYSICETTTHYFLIYMVYHVLDWWKRYKPKGLYDAIRDMLDEHIHDMEGALLVLTKYPEKRMQLRVDALVTVAHCNFFLHTESMVPIPPRKYRRASSSNLRIVKFNETIDGNIWLDHATKRVKLYIESRGHGIRGDHRKWGGGDEIWYYYPEEEKTKPGTIDSREKNIRRVKYQLEDIFTDNGLWDHRFNTKVFRQNKNGQWGFVYLDKKNKLHGGTANPPWSWNDHNDSSPIGEIATDPARFVIRYAQGWGPVSTNYICNPYQSVDHSSQL
jgi:hypothetical protein